MMTWKIKKVDTVKFAPIERNGETIFAPLKQPMTRVVLVNEFNVEIIITKGASFTVKNPPVKKPQYIETGRGKVINRWAPSVTVPGPVSNFPSKVAFRNYIKERFGDRLGQEIVECFNDYSRVR
jgi:hypothetical protein